MRRLTPSPSRPAAGPRSRGLVTMLALLSLAGCASLPTTRTTVPSTAITDTADTTLGRVIPGALARLNGPTGVRLMEHRPDAFLARLALVRAAERSIDAQILHLAARRHRAAPDRRAAARGGPRRAGAPADRRLRVGRQRSRPADAGSARPHRSPPLQPDRQPLQANAEHGGRLSPASTGGCTTSRSPPTTRSPSSAAATSATSTSRPVRACSIAISMRSRLARW